MQLGHQSAHKIFGSHAIHEMVIVQVLIVITTRLKANLKHTA